MGLAITAATVVDGNLMLQPQRDAAQEGDAGHGRKCERGGQSDGKRKVGVQR